MRVAWIKQCLFKLEFSHQQHRYGTAEVISLNVKTGCALLSAGVGKLGKGLLQNFVLQQTGKNRFLPKIITRFLKAVMDVGCVLRQLIYLLRMRKVLHIQIQVGT